MRRLVRGALFLMGLAFALPTAAQSLSDAVNAQARGDYATAAQIYSSLCHSGRDPHSCWKAASTLYQTPNWTNQKGFDLMTLACEYSDGFYCYNAGVSFENGDPFPQDISIAMDFYRKGCNKNAYPACHALAGNWVLGRGTKQDYDAAVGAMMYRCDVAPANTFGGGVPGQVCVELADFLGYDTQRRKALGDDIYFGQIESTLTKGCKRHRYAPSCIAAAELVLKRLDSARGQPELYNLMASRARQHLDSAAELLPISTGVDLDAVRADLPRLNQLLEDKLAGRE